MSKNSKYNINNNKPKNKISDKELDINKSSFDKNKIQQEKNNKNLKCKSCLNSLADIEKILCDIHEVAFNEKKEDKSKFCNLDNFNNFKEFVSSCSKNNMIGVYFSGTGNTKHCINYLLSQYNKKIQNYSIEDENIIEKIKSNNKIVFGYPIQFSNIPKIVKDFILNNKNIWMNKQIFIMVTMGAFSGDGTGVAARLFRKNGAIIIGGLQLKMPQAICDMKRFKKTNTKTESVIQNAERKIVNTINALKNGKECNNGLGLLAHIFGSLGQRLWFFSKTSKYSNKLKINKQLCAGCALCVKKCPMKNIDIIDDKAVSNNKCAMCYRCANLCPHKAITLFGKKVFYQKKIIK